MGHWISDSWMRAYRFGDSIQGRLYAIKFVLQAIIPFQEFAGRLVKILEE